jgi:serine/threonine protein kinase
MIGQSLGRYTIEAKLGEGGMGVLFQARDTQLERVVAIKILPPDRVSDRSAGVRKNDSPLPAQRPGAPLSDDGGFEGGARGSRDRDVQRATEPAGSAISTVLTTMAYGPSWSPDGRTIAFLRRAPGASKNDVRLIAPLGGPERTVADVQPGAALYRPISLSWCPDASCVVVTDSLTDRRAHWWLAYAPALRWPGTASRRS